jgi:3-oxoadipate enol-lactonase
LPGYGGSAATGAPDLDTLVGAVRWLIGHPAPGRTVLLGHRMGGMVAQELLVRTPRRGPGAASPPRVVGLVLSCTSAAFGRHSGRLTRPLEETAHAHRGQPEHPDTAAA